MMNRLTEIADILRKKDNIAVACHTFPDGDALGSVVAMVMALRKMGKNCYILSKDQVMQQLVSLPLVDEVNSSPKEVKEGTELVLVLDCGNFDRVSFDQKTLKRVTLINVDHHKTNDAYGDYNYVDSKASATGEIVFDLIKLLGVEIDKDMAAAIYSAITTDTGSFRFESTTRRTHEIVGELIETGIKFQEISRELFESKSLERLKLTGRALMSLTPYLNGKVNIMILKENDFLDFNVQDRDTGDIINYGLMPQEAEVSMVLKEAEGKVRVSIRTKKKVDAGQFAEMFKGGGHKRAAGLTLDTPNFEEAKEILLKEIEVYLY